MVRGKQPGAFQSDEYNLPTENPWESRLRASGIDFSRDGKSAYLCFWDGDVWKVDGIADESHNSVEWKRIAAGLFQPLGIKIRNGEIFVSCRDQIVRLVDLNGDEETDFYEAFNSDHQVTEHFHEFAMGCRRMNRGNFYYAKSALYMPAPQLIPHHGTLIKVTADGSSSDVLAHGFRAANGVCRNPDGTFCDGSGGSLESAEPDQSCGSGQREVLREHVQLWCPQGFLRLGHGATALWAHKKV